VTAHTPDLLEISVPLGADGEAAEAVCELFERYGGGAVIEVHPQPSDRPSAAGADAAARTWVRTYLPADDVHARARVEVGLWRLGQIHPLPEALVRRLAHANWAEAWKAHYTPQRIGRHLRVVPSWLAVEVEPADRVIRLDPGMAFGTGLHPTTRLCLEELEERVRPGLAVLDVGTGSGILAIAAARLGAGRVLALDIDPQAAAIAAANAANNGVAIETVAGELAELPAETFDLVVANLLAGLLIELAAGLAARCRPGGQLVAGGILADQAAAVGAALAAAGFGPSSSRASGDWVALVAAAPGSGPPLPAAARRRGGAAARRTGGPAVR
jgi:ribosomal protein L11 methyltransferase